jgi:hypothetical protein
MRSGREGDEQSHDGHNSVGPFPPRTLLFFLHTLTPMPIGRCSSIVTTPPLSRPQDHALGTTYPRRCIVSWPDYFPTYRCFRVIDSPRPAAKVHGQPHIPFGSDPAVLLQYPLLLFTLCPRPPKADARFSDLSRGIHQPISLVEALPWLVADAALLRPPLSQPWEACV